MTVSENFHGQLHRVQTFLAVVDFGSYTRAAQYLGISKAMASLHIKALEQALASTLLIRTTRQVTLTETGQALYDEFKGIVANIDTAFDNVLHGRDRVSGKLRISSTAEYAETFVLPILPLFTARYPEVRLSYHFNSSLNDLVAEKLDLVIRLGHLADSGFKGRQLADYAIVLVASPALLKDRQVTQPEELDAWPWIGNSNLGGPPGWTFSHPRRGEVEVKVSPGHESNSATAIRAMALAGLGLAVLPEWMVLDDLGNGRLVRVLPEYRLATQPVHVLFPNSAHLPRKSRVFIDFLAEHLGR
ncbi:LysR family transcriptional regulator [Pseudomonas protegens]|uniref:LysR family transcriptional regulator n=1 Tax=Pseudomonas protegens TaxID=380021 RepID=UPI00069DC73A|nr:LysR family transcriptional regulator [Pseudomonas protegens]APC20568.1 LysR family transcriptional regulator [Pseudomonas protegens]MBF0638885.1 LysR family transcriptional regulator [Pseudomonas protegens]MBP5095016.1 LysR family transcriptional regulator [Pseudomonas protegens]MBP5104904.1 LysR family transcriptional regulator [Pseudomonas protegens]MBP5128824.1 LysR family transcriptional regulator [Pseudomonas protegens]